ncbi:hypothetical protein [Azorhizophilus paspali]|uniref:Uncharacterized protein n=2 Tax=Azorhizophilus paspali TaxID=69963 RepID=A0ABV6SLC2_AZOPA
MSSMTNLEHSGTARVHASDLVHHARDNKRVARELDRLHLHDLANELRGFADNQMRMARMWLPRRRSGYFDGSWKLLRLMEKNSRPSYRRREN